MDILKDRKVKIILATIIAYIVVFLIPKTQNWNLYLFIIPYGIIAFDYIKEVVFTIIINN